MRKLTDKKVYFPKLDLWGHLYQAYYHDGNIAIVAGEEGRIGKISVNLVDLLSSLGPNDFYVRLYGTGKYVNDPCFETGLFERIGKPFQTEQSFETAWFEKWRLLK